MRELIEEKTLLTELIAASATHIDLFEVSPSYTLHPGSMKLGEEHTVIVHIEYNCHG